MVVEAPSPNNERRTAPASPVEQDFNGFRLVRLVRLVPTPSVGTLAATLRVPRRTLEITATEFDAERQDSRSHAERGNEFCAL